MKKTFKELKEIDIIVGTLYAKNPSIKDGKFGYWYTKFLKKNYNPIQEEINEKISDCQLLNALVDEKTKEILYTDEFQKQYKFDKEGRQRLIDFIRKIDKEYNDKEIEIIPCISSEVPEELFEEDKELLRGLII